MSHTIWLISINVPVSLLLLVTCLFFLRVEYNDFNFSSEWGLAGLDQNQPRPDISKNEKIIGMHHLNWSLLNWSPNQSTFGLLTVRWLYRGVRLPNGRRLYTARSGFEPYDHQKDASHFTIFSLFSIPSIFNELFLCKTFLSKSSDENVPWSRSKFGLKTE